MNKQIETKATSIRLGVDRWAKLRALMRHHKGRSWLEALIDTAYSKVFNPKEKNNDANGLRPNPATDK